MSSSSLFRRARRLWNIFEACAECSLEGSFRRLYRAYGGRKRHYHDRAHVVDVVERVDRMSRGISSNRRSPLLAAAWYHDIVYACGRPDNEERSARAVAIDLRRGGFDRRMIDEAARLVMSTKRHLPKSLDKTAKVLVDADLATLSARSDRYQTYANAIRREYAWVPEPAYRAGRAALLRAFLERPSIYRTRRMRRHECDARANILNEILCLEALPGVDAIAR